MEIKTIFLLSWKKFSITSIIFIIFFFFRNIINRFLGISHHIISIIYAIIPIYILICAIYNLTNRPRKKNRRKKTKKITIKSSLLLSWKKLSLTLIVWIISVVIHNFGSAIIGFEEPVFFLLAVIGIPIYLILSVLYSLHYLIKSTLKKEKGVLKKVK